MKHYVSKNLNKQISIGGSIKVRKLKRLIDLIRLNEPNTKLSLRREIHQCKDRKEEEILLAHVFLVKLEVE